MRRVSAGLVLLLASCGGGESPPPPPVPEPAAPAPPTESPPPHEPPPSEASPSEDPVEAPAVPVAPGTLRLVAVGPEARLPSEQRSLEGLARGLGRHLEAVDVADPDEAERRAAEALLAGTLAALPAVWADRETVLVTRLRPPRTTRRGARATQGSDRIVVIRPPELEPVYAEAIDEGGRLLTPRATEWLLPLLPEASD
ncbi:MAG: hypothetical protein AAGH15_13605 [Myxococcota bacterium]